MAKLLIVDDEETYRTQLSMILTAEGHEVWTARSGREAIDVGHSCRPDVLVADWRLTEGTSGLRVAETLCQADPRLRVIMMTGYSADDLQVHLKSADFHILEKPFGVEDLLGVVQQALPRKAEQPGSSE
ncbi:MAG: response regulator [Phycisphaerae bacterium]|nr:response regulator [Phycisphaerae bacterium]